MMVVQLNGNNYSEIASKIMMFYYIIEVIANRQMCLTNVLVLTQVRTYACNNVSTVNRTCVKKTVENSGIKNRFQMIKFRHITFFLVVKSYFYYYNIFHKFRVFNLPNFSSSIASHFIP